MCSKAQAEHAQANGKILLDVSRLLGFAVPGQHINFSAQGMPSFPKFIRHYSQSLISMSNFLTEQALLAFQWSSRLAFIFIYENKIIKK